MKKILFILILSVFCGAGLRAQDRNVTPSPDGTMVAFTRDNDLWVRSVADSVETRLTFDGSELNLNGYASWVYYEEIFGRGSRYKAFWWSPDSKRLGFYRFDNTHVPMFPIYSPFGQDGKLNQTRYPKAGEPNPSVRIGIIEAKRGAQPVWADFDDSPEQYFGTPFWGADSRELYISREPRRQSVLDLYAVSVADGSKRQVYHEEYPDAWVEWIEGMIFTDKGLYMARNFETGWEQIYFLGYDGTLKRLTDGENWGIRLLKVDEKKGEVWFTAKRDDRLHTTLARRQEPEAARLGRIPRARLRPARRVRRAEVRKPREAGLPPAHDAVPTGQKGPGHGPDGHGAEPLRRVDLGGWKALRGASLHRPDAADDRFRPDGQVCHADRLHPGRRPGGGPFAATGEDRERRLRPLRPDVGAEGLRPREEISRADAALRRPRHALRA